MDRRRGRRPVLRRVLPLVLAGAVVLGGSSLPGAAAQSGGAEAGEQVLVFSRTTGFRHSSIEVGVEAVRSLGADNGFTVEATEDPTAFTDENLDRFDVVIWLNTTGNVLDGGQRAAFERYVRSGGGWVGVHSAADTEYDSAFYTRLLSGARFLAHPIQQPGRLVVESTQHPSTAHLGGEWLLPFEEFYSFVRNPRPDVRVLLTIDESSYDQDPNTSNLPTSPTFPEGVTGTMGDHPMAWCNDIDAGRVWYTALGHEAYLYALPDYRAHLLGGILTAAGRLPAGCSATAGGLPGAAPAAPAGPAAPPSAPVAAAPAAGSRSLPATGASSGALALVVLAVALALHRRGEAGSR